MNKLSLVRILSAAFGASDAVTGLALILFPSLVLRLLSIDPASNDSEIYLRWIGVFVLGVGLSYACCFSRSMLRGETVWIVTSIVRGLVSLFLILQVLSGQMPSAWLAVALFDGMLAALQILLVRRGWWKEAGA
ncbi:MAG: hypothetical protein ACO3RV_08525 [Luteolibacter sp.]